MSLTVLICSISIIVKCLEVSFMGSVFSLSLTMMVERINLRWMVASGRVKVVQIQSEMLVIIPSRVGCSVSCKMVNVMRVSVVVLPVCCVRIPFSLVIQIYIILDVVFEVTFP